MVKAANKGNDRTCIVSRETAPREGLIRFVLDPDNNVVPDIAEKLPGRGMWVRARAEDIETAVRKQFFARAAKQKAKAPDDLLDQVTSQLRRQALNRLGMARRAGALVLGFEKVRELVTGPKGDRLVALLAARDGAADGRKKLTAKTANWVGAVDMVECFDSAELEQALGRERVIHGALTRSGASDAFLRDVKRLEHLLAGDAPADTGQGLSVDGDREAKNEERSDDDE